MAPETHTASWWKAGRGRWQSGADAEGWGTADQSAESFRTLKRIKSQQEHLPATVLGKCLLVQLSAWPPFAFTSPLAYIRANRVCAVPPWLMVYICGASAGAKSAHTPACTPQPTFRVLGEPSSPHLPYSKCPATLPGPASKGRNRTSSLLAFHPNSAHKYPIFYVTTRCVGILPANVPHGELSGVSEGGVVKTKTDMVITQDTATKLPNDKTK